MTTSRAGGPVIRLPRAAALLLLGFAFVLGPFGGRAEAHPLAPVDLTLVLAPEGAELSLDLGWHVLNSDTTDDAAADAYLAAQLRSTGDARAAWLARVRAWLTARIHLTCDDSPMPLRVSMPDLETPGQAELPPETLPRLRVEAAAPFARPPTACAARLDEALGTVVLRVRRPGHFADDTRLLSPGVASPPWALLPPSDDSRGATALEAPPPPPEPSLFEFILVGFEHIVPEGLDHVLFVLALFFLGAHSNGRLLLWQVTAFTVAHSLTLALGMAGLARLPDAVVEPTIAASIAFVALEDVFGGPTAIRRRVAVVFLFGLIHGLGFAGALMEAGLPEGRFVTTLVGFNVGVELGQLAVLAAAFAVTWPLRRLVGDAAHDTWVRRPACLAIAATGLYWTFERLA